MNLLDNVCTKEDADLLESELDTILSNLFKKNIGQVLKKEIRLKTLEELKKNFADFSNTEKVEVALNKVKDEIRKLKVLSLSIGFEPAEQTLETIFEWVKKNMGEGIVLDIKIDKGILGGAVIAYEGKYRDESVKKMLDDSFIKRV